MKKFAKTKTPDAGKERIIMSKNKLRERRIKKLRRGKIKSVGLFEAFKVWIVGRIDGIRGLPKKTDDGKLTSPWLDKQINAYEEFCCDTWGHLQVEDEEVYSRIDELADVVERTQQQLVHAKTAVERAQETENTIPVSRMEGEESLNDNQVRTRRSNEKEKRLAPLNNRVNVLENTITASVAELTDLLSSVIEDNYTTHMICERVRDHVLQRIDIYWNSMLRKHAESSTMPPIPAIDLTHNAELTYDKLHKPHMERAESLRTVISIVNKEKEAA